MPTPPKGSDTRSDRSYSNDGRRVHDSADQLVDQVREANEKLVLATLRAEDSEATFRSLFDAMPQLGWIARADGYIHFYNRGWYEFTGTTFEQMEGWGWRSVHDPELLPSIEARWRACIEAGAPFEHSFPIRRHDGVYRWFLTRANPERDSAGNVVRWVGINTDIDEQRRNEQQLAGFLEREQRARAEAIVAGRKKDEFLAMLAHELRNPLAALSTAQHLIAQDGSTDPHMLRLRAITERQVQHLVRIVDDLLDVSRISHGKIELRKQKVNLATVLRNALQVTRIQMDTKSQEVSLVGGVSPSWVEGDPTRLEQVFTNLLTNAAKYTDDGGRITMRCTNEQHGDAAWVVVEIEDTGQGLAPSMVEHVFELFTQVDGSLERTRGGLGIGLTLVRRLVELHGGTVQARSEGLGRGSTFTVRLPRVAAPEDARRPVKRGVSGDSSINHRVVVVEDNDDTRELMKEMLQSWGYEVEVAADGVSGSALILSSLPDMAFVDVGLPGLNGFEVAESVRASPESAKTLLVALTGYGGAEMREQALAAGFDQHLVKPVRAEVLEQVLATRRSF